MIVWVGSNGAKDSHKLSYSEPSDIVEEDTEIMERFITDVVKKHEIIQKIKQGIDKKI